jgi:hypothetical protein
MYLAVDKATPNGDYSCEMIYKIKNGKIIVLAEKINGRTTSAMRFRLLRAYTQMLETLRRFLSHFA